MGALVERHRLAVRSECFKTHAAARARRGLVRIFALTRMAAHQCARLSPLQAWRSIFCASLQTVKGSILAYVSRCTRCRARRAARRRRSEERGRVLVGGVLGAPARPLGRAASMWRVGRRERPKRCGAGVYMS